MPSKPEIDIPEHAPSYQLELDDTASAARAEAKPVTEPPGEGR